MVRVRVSIIFVALAFISADLSAADLRYWDWGQTPKRENYEFQLLELALQETQQSHGPYSLSRIKVSYSTSRVRREINENGAVNIRTGPYLPSHKFGSPEEINRPVKVDTLFGLLGYRKLLAHSDSIESFQAFAEIDDLATKIAGLGKGWADVDILRTNHLPVNDSANVDYLLPMLERRRFDYFPVGVLELDNVMASWPNPEVFGVVPDLMLFYELPVLFYVGKNEQALAQRIEIGLKAAMDDGKMQDLFRKHFSEELELINDPKVKVFRIGNPFLESEDAQEILRPGLSAI